MKFHDDRTLPLPLGMVAVQARRLVLPPEVVKYLPSAHADAGD